jgi:hypothetical protein
MAQIFHRSTNFISRFSVFASLFLAGLALTGVLLAARSPYLTNQNVTRDQPIQFSHKHHAGDDGIDCRYCHTGVGRQRRGMFHLPRASKSDAADVSGVDVADVLVPGLSPKSGKRVEATRPGFQYGLESTSRSG